MGHPCPASGHKGDQLGVWWMQFYQACFPSTRLEDLNSPLKELFLERAEKGLAAPTRACSVQLVLGLLAPSWVPVSSCWGCDQIWDDGRLPERNSMPLPEMVDQKDTEKSQYRKLCWEPCHRTIRSPWAGHWTAQICHQSSACHTTGISDSALLSA